MKPPFSFILMTALGLALGAGLTGNAASPTPPGAGAATSASDSAGGAAGAAEAGPEEEITPEMLAEALGELPPELREELAPPEVSPWDLSVDVRGGVGYNDNVLLGPNRPERSAYWQTGLDLFLFRLPTEGAEFSLMVFGEDTRYFSARSTRKEQLYFGRAQIRRRQTGKGSAHLAVEYLYQNQILDASTTEFDLSIVPARGHTATLEPGWSWSLGRAGALELELPVSRQWYEQPLDSYWEAALRPGWTRKSASGRTRFAVTYEAQWRPYDTRRQVSADGFLVPDTRLRYFQQGVALEWRQDWDRHDRWHSTVKLAFDRNSDNGAGYFDYDRWYARGRLRYEAGPWEVSTRLSAAFYDYDLQRANGPDSGRRHKLLLTAELKVSRELGGRFKAFLEGAHEESLANDDTDEYAVNRVVTGVEAGF